MNILNNLRPLFWNCFQVSSHFIGNACSVMSKRIHDLATSIFKAFTDDSANNTAIEHKFEEAKTLLERCQRRLNTCETNKNVKELCELSDEMLEDIRTGLYNLKIDLSIYDQSMCDIELSVLEQPKYVVFNSLERLCKKMCNFHNDIEYFLNFCDTLNELRKYSQQPNTDEIDFLKFVHGDSLFKMLASIKRNTSLKELNDEQFRRTVLLQ